MRGSRRLVGRAIRAEPHTVIKEARMGGIRERRMTKSLRKPWKGEERNSSLSRQQTENKIDREPSEKEGGPG